MTAPPARLAEMRALLWQGLTRAATARAMGVGVGVVAGMVRRHGIGAPPPPPPPPRPDYYRDAPGPGACHWLISDGRPWRFCPEPRAPGSQYCAAHRAVAYPRRHAA